MKVKFVLKSELSFNEQGYVMGVYSLIGITHALKETLQRVVDLLKIKVYFYIEYFTVKEILLARYYLYKIFL